MTALCRSVHSDTQREAAVNMNNLNDPQDWNIRPERQGDGGDSSKWNYALLVPMLGLAAFRWIWSKQFEKEIEDTKVKMQDLDLERQALASQSQKLKKENHDIKLECSALKGKMFRFHEALKKGREQEQEALKALEIVQNGLVQRQEDFCSPFVHQSKRVRVEEDLLAYTAKEPHFAHLEMENDLRDIFKNDRSCAEYLNTDPKKNGCLMWLYLRHWKVQLALQQHQRAEAAIINMQTKN